MEHGLVVTHIHNVMQFQRNPVFKHLADEVTFHRSAADREPDKKVLAELFKLLGNSYYGKCLTNKENHLDVSYMGEEPAARAVNRPSFRRLDEVAEGW